MTDGKLLKPPVEIFYQQELQALKTNDTFPKPANWQLSPQAVRTFILGSETPIPLEGQEITIEKKFYGNDTLVERAIITLAGNRGLMLVGEPGTAKTMLSELLSAAICGTSTNTIQGTAGLTEDMIKYSWNYALLLDKGPTPQALVPSPVYLGMRQGTLTRFEEITRAPAEVQDSLVSILSDKVLHIPELGEEGVIFARPGFNLVATANTRDKGVNEMSSALKRRFNFETVQPIADVSLEARIIEQESAKLLSAGDIRQDIDRDAVEVLAMTFHELREGVSAEGSRIDRPAAVMSTAEAVSVFYQSAMSAYYYGGKKIDMDTLVQNIIGAVLKESREDLEKIRNYFGVIVKQRGRTRGKTWKDFYEARKWIK